MPDWPTHLHIQQNIPLKPYTKIEIGGPARYLTEIDDVQKLQQVVKLCRDFNVRLVTIGSGTNLFFADRGMDALAAVLKMNKTNIDGTKVTAQAGVLLSDVVYACAEADLTGFEFATGIPGTVGGAIFGNAGAYGKAVGDILYSAQLLTPEGSIIFAGKDQLDFTYRSSRLKKSEEIVIEAVFTLSQGIKNQIKGEMDRIRRLRSSKLPDDTAKTAGSWFKNIKDAGGQATAAAVYLDAVGSKQTRVNDAGIYEKHANIFINSGHATAQDMLQLEKILKDRVSEKFNILLEREVMFIS
ncbi:UDP-N-acetylmuramate dehydrogenase [candidate division KSB1 bacterium]|nr:UDP-N-acetylmuramate dehydrogenase [candidate division KSB1 bacterium]